MPVPRVFISSTYYDLRYIRASIEAFVKSYGFQPVLFERGSIGYDADIPLDYSAYREVTSCQILILIIGGRYGAESSRAATEEQTSITRQEYTTAVEAGIPTYAFVEEAVYLEHETYSRNRRFKEVEYAHVQSSRVYEFMDYIVGLGQNNPLFPFREASEIIDMLRQQWAALYFEYLSQRKEYPRIRAIESAVGDLRDAVDRLEAYTERIVRDVDDDGAEALFAEQRLATQNRRLNRLFEEFKSSTMGRFIGRFKDLSDASEWSSLVLRSRDIREFMLACGVPRNDIEYVAERSWAAERYRWLRGEIEDLILVNED